MHVYVQILEFLFLCICNTGNLLTVVSSTHNLLHATLCSEISSLCRVEETCTIILPSPPSNPGLFQAKIPIVVTTVPIRHPKYFGHACHLQQRTHAIVAIYEGVFKTALIQK